MSLSQPLAFATPKHARIGRLWPAAAAGLLMVALQWVPGVATALQLERATLGELWRFATCHFVHFDAEHLLYSGGMLVVLGAVALERDRRGTWLSLLLAGVAIPIAVLALQPGITHYRGASGLDSALFALLTTGMLREAARRSDRVSVAATTTLIALFLAKIGYELVTGEAAFADSGTFTPVPLAHLVGATAGLAVAIVRGR